jgi:heptosyltransferase II
VSVTGKLLVVGPSWVGDMVMAQSLYRALRARAPARRIDVVAPPWSMPVLERMPEVARAIELPVGHGEAAIGTRWRLGRRLRREGYDRAIVLPRSMKAALVPWFAGIRQRTGFRGEWRHGVINDMRPFDPVVLDQTVTRFVALAPETAGEPPPAVLRPALAVDQSNQQRLIDRLGLDTLRPVVALMPGAEYGEAKRWPVERYAELAGRLSESGTAVWVIGSAREAPLGEAIAAARPRGSQDSIRNLCGATTLADAVDLLAMARVAISNDSGLMHIAAAVDTHVIAIYGSSSPRFTPPLTDARTVIHLDLSCSPCWQRQCPLSHLRCLRDIDVATVLSAAQRALAAVREARQ